MDKKRFPIGVQLAGMFALVSILFLAVMTYTLVQFKDAGREAEVIVTKTTVQMIGVKNGHTEFTRALLDMRGFLFYPDGASYEKGYQEKIHASLAMVQEVKKELTEPEARQAAEVVEKALEEYISYADTRMLPARRTNASNWMSITTEGRAKVQAIDAGFLKLSEIQKLYLDKSGMAVLQSSKDDSNLAIMLSVLILLVVIILVVYYSRNMSKRLGRLSQSLEQVGRLDLTGQDLYPTRNDEIGDMGLVVINMRHVLTEVVQQIADNGETLAAAAEELTAGVNEHLVAVNTVAESINEIAAGHLKMPIILAIFLLHWKKSQQARRKLVQRQ